MISIPGFAEPNDHRAIEGGDLDVEFTAGIVGREILDGAILNGA